MFRYCLMLSNSHEMLVDAPTLDVATQAAQAKYPDAYIVGHKIVGVTPESEEESNEDE